MKRAVVFIFLVPFLTLNLNSQELTTKWSEKIDLHNSRDGFFSYFLGENEKYIYAYFEKKGVSERKKIVAFDKKTMQRRFSSEVIGYPSNGQESKKYNGLSYYKTIIYDDVVYAFFKSFDKNSNTLLVKTFSPELKVEESMKIVTSQVRKIQRKNKAASLFVLGNKKIGKVFIGVEKEIPPNSNVKLEYRVLKTDFSISESNQITLPIEYKGGSWLYGGADGLSSSYELGDDGNIHIRTTITLDKDERKENKRKMTKGKYLNSLSYSLLGILKLNTGELITKPIRMDGKKLFSIYKMVTENKTRLYGYYSDFSKDKKGSEVHGIFYAVLNDDYELRDIKFSNFNKKLIKELFKGDKDDKDGGRKAGCCLIGKKKSTHANDETMNSDYIIEQAIEGKNGSVFLFTTKMRNYEVTTCNTDANGNQTCNTSYYCQKGNVTTFKLSKDGGIEWASNYDRTKTYRDWDIYDLNVVEDDNGFYATYGSVDNKRAKKPWFMFLKKVDYTNPMEYIFIDRFNGDVSKRVLKVNKPDTPSKRAKYIDATQITVIDNKLYVNSSMEFINPLGYPVYCLGGCVLPNLMGNFYNGYGFFGVLEPAIK